VIALMGCLVGHKPSPDLTARFPFVDVFLPPSTSRPLIDILQAHHHQASDEALERDATAMRWRIQDDLHPGRITLPEHEQGNVVGAHVPLVYGCNHVCSFCIIPSRRGPEVSRPADEVVDHVRSLVDQGVREVTLLGQIVDRYGYDLGEPDLLPRLLRTLNDVDGLERIRFLTSHPNYMTDTLLDAVAELPKVMEQLEVPVQAGDDVVLERMRRGYTSDTYRRLVGRIRERIPGAAVHTDIIVGFPGETAEQFERTFSLLEELELDKAHIARFSMRPGTLAAKRMTDDVPQEEKERRRKALDELQTSVCADINRALRGTTVQVLVDGKSQGRWRGRTRTNKLVFFHDDRALAGELVDIEVRWTGPWSMIGHVPGTPVDAPLDVIPVS
jgi:tRNA-2-methylthio-N6-dimethylallyladenosine synthase